MIELLEFFGRNPEFIMNEAAYILNNEPNQNKLVTINSFEIDNIP